MTPDDITDSVAFRRAMNEIGEAISRAFNRVNAAALVGVQSEWVTVLGLSTGHGLKVSIALRFEEELSPTVTAGLRRFGMASVKPCAVCGSTGPHALGPVTDHPCVVCASCGTRIPV